MLESCFQRRHAICRYRESPAGSVLDGYAGVLLAEGQSADSCRRHVGTAAHLGKWAARRGIPLPALDENVLSHFACHLSHCHCRPERKRPRYRGSPFHAQRFLCFLREIGVASPPPTQTRPLLVIELERWMRTRAGLSERTIACTTQVVESFLDRLGEDPAEFSAAAVRTFVLKHVSRHAPRSPGMVTGSVRRFLRFLIAAQQCSPDLLEAVPRIPAWRQARLPNYLPREDVERIIAAAVHEHHRGTALRNRALLLLLARIGLRAHEVVGLRFDDIDWQGGRLRILGKGRREAWLPLPQDAGDAVLRYLEARPAIPTDHIFLTSHAPLKPFTSAGLRRVVHVAIERAGVRAPTRGSHLLRHSLATSLLRDGAPLDTIGAVLRHRDLDTTAIYAKVDVEALREVAQPWPSTEVAPC